MKSKKLILFGLIFLVIILFKLTLISAACISGGSGWNRGCVSATRIHGVTATGAYWEENCCAGLYCCQNNQWGCYSTAVSCACTAAGLIWYNGACCTLSTWTPDPSTICSGTSFTQTSNCGTTRAATGTKQPNCPAASIVQCGQSIISTNGCGTCSGTGTQCQSGYNCQNGNCVVGSLPPKGTFDQAGCEINSVLGWACDANDYNHAIDIHFYIDGEAGAGGTMIGATTANKVRESAVGTQCGGNSTHGFEWTIPDSLKDGQQHTIYVYGIDYPNQNNNPKLDGSPKTINCAGPVIIPNCVTINGLQYCCGDNTDNVCPSDFENATGYHFVCGQNGLPPDNNCLGVQPTQCTIEGIKVTPICGIDNCSAGENIKIEVNYSGTRCPTPSYIQVDANSTDGSCDIQNYGGILRGMNITCTSGKCIGQWTIPPVPTQCLGKTIYAYAVGLYNDSIINAAHWVAGNTTGVSGGNGLIIHNYGSFNFSSIPIIIPSSYNLSVYTRSWPGLGLITGVNVLLDGVDKGLTINPKILTFVSQGIHTISGTSKTGYTVNPVTLNVTQNLDVIVIYNSTSLNSFNFNITARDKDTKEIIAAPITLQLTNSSGTFTVKTVTNGNLIYDYTKAYPMNYIITFGQVSGYTNTPQKIQGSTTSNGFLWLNVYYTPFSTCTSCSDGTLPGRCNSAGKYCSVTCSLITCQPGYTCVANQGCVLEIVPTCDFSSDPTCTNNLCFWNSTKCKACSANDPTSCSSYKTDYACTKDNCGMNISGGDVASTCSGADTCKCSWNSGTGTCSLVATYLSGGSCDSMITAQTDCGTSQCTGNQRLVTFDKTWSQGEPAPETCQDESTCVACAGFRLLPGFDYVNVILVLALLAGYYSYSFVRKKK